MARKKTNKVRLIGSTVRSPCQPTSAHQKQQSITHVWYHSIMFNLARIWLLSSSFSIFGQRSDSQNLERPHPNRTTTRASRWGFKEQGYLSTRLPTRLKFCAIFRWRSTNMIQRRSLRRKTRRRYLMKIQRSTRTTATTVCQNWLLCGLARANLWAFYLSHPTYNICFRLAMLISINMRSRSHLV